METQTKGNPMTTTTYSPDDLLRDVRLEAITGRIFRLRLWDTNTYDHLGKSRLAYRFEQTSPRDTGETVAVLFEGADFCASPCHAVDADETVRALLGFLTLRPGDTDADYFANYTDAQRSFCDTDAEWLSVYALEDSDDALVEWCE
jgi:hypothetical protein